MNIQELQHWLNDHGATPKIIEDGVAGPKTRSAILQVFKNKNATLASNADILNVAKMLGDSSVKRVVAVSKVETGGSGFTNDGFVKLLWERHYFYRFVNKVIYFDNKKDQYVAYPEAGGYTLDDNDNNINDSWEKLTYAACVNPDAAFQSMSIGKFQVMGKYYKELGYDHPIEMLWDASRNEASHYKMLANYIIKVANLKSAFLKMDGNPENCRAFAKGYNGSTYIKYDYHNKLAKALK